MDPPPRYVNQSGVGLRLHHAQHVSVKYYPQNAKARTLTAAGSSRMRSIWNFLFLTRGHVMDVHVDPPCLFSEHGLYLPQL